MFCKTGRIGFMKGIEVNGGSVVHVLPKHRTWRLKRRVFLVTST